VPDQIFAEPRLAAIYDAADADRADLDAYAAIVAEVGAQRVLDVGCGTGVLACMLASCGLEVIGIDPAFASLEVARGKPGADRVRWLHGVAADVPPLEADLAVMTGNVAQVFLKEEEWLATLRAIRASLRPGGALVFEVRDPARRAWERWTRERTHRHLTIPAEGLVETWVEVTEVRPPFVSFRHTYVFQSDGATLTSESTLKFRQRAEVEASLTTAGFTVREVRDAPDRPGLEFVFIALRDDSR